ncbi:MAG: prepilin peptidase [Acidimicrobiia bacterium]
MRTLLVAGSALLGLLAGPLVSLVVIRVPRRQPLLGTSTTCPGCATTFEHPGGWLSAAIPRPALKCPGCGASAGGRPRALGIACAALFAVAAWRFSDSWALPAYLLLFGTLLAISVIDYQHHIVPNRILVPVVVVSLALLGGGSLADGVSFAFVRGVLGGAAAFGILLMMNLVSPQGLGMGDVKLAFLLGLYLGWLGWALVAVGLFLGFVLGGVGGLVLILAGIRDRRDHIAFAPFLSAGAVLGVLFGTSLLSWYPAL